MVASKQLRLAVETEEDKKIKTGECCSYQTSQVGHGDGRRKKSKTGEDGSYQIAQVGHGDGRRKKARLEKMIATHSSGWPWRQRKREEH